MAPWIVLVFVLPFIVAISLVNSLRAWLRAAVVRHPVLAARSFLSVSIALWLAWLFGVPVHWALKWSAS